MSTSTKKGMFDWYFKSNLLLRILIGLILGAICGLLFSGNESLIAFFKPFGDVFIRLLKMIVIPVIAMTLISGTSSISPKSLGRIGVKIIIFYIVTSFFAICMGLFFGNLLSPGEGLKLAGDMAAAGKELTPPPSLINLLVGIIPKNPFSAFSNGVVLSVICFSLFFGIALAFLKDSEDAEIKEQAMVVSKFFEGCTQIMFKIIHWIMEYAPIGVFALIFIVFSKNGAAAFGPLASVTFTVYLALIVQGVLIYGIIAYIFKLPTLKFFKKVRSPMITAFVTRSSGGTLPVSMETADEEMGVKKGVYSFTLPIGATINMDGTTIYLGVCAMFIANAVGIPLTFSQQSVIILTAVLASIGTAGVPGAGAIMLLMVLDSVGLKVETGSAVAAAYAMIFGIDALLDMGRTSMNVVGDMLGTAVVAKSEGDMDMKAWDKS